MFALIDQNYDYDDDDDDDDDNDDDDDDDDNGADGHRINPRRVVSGSPISN